MDLPPLRQVRHFPSGVVTERPYPSRIFGLPKTHAITHAATSSPDDLDFHVWGLSFFTGMRLTTTERGFLDATPIKPRTLVDFVLIHGLERAIDLLENYRVTHAATPHRARMIAAAIHANGVSEVFTTIRVTMIFRCLDTSVTPGGSQLLPWG